MTFLFSGTVILKKKKKELDIRRFIWYGLRYQLKV